MVVIYCYLERDSDRVLKVLLNNPLALKESPPSNKCREYLLEETKYMNLLYMVY